MTVVTTQAPLCTHARLCFGHLICCARLNLVSLLPVDALNMSHTAISMTRPSDPATSLKDSTPIMNLCVPILRYGG